MGFDQKHYVPILKAKAGELRALKEASDTVRRSITPVLEVTGVPSKYIEGSDDPMPSKSDDAHIKTVAQNIAKNWGAERPVFIDGFYIEDMATLPDGREPISAVLDYLRDESIKAVPVTGIDRYAEYTAAIAAAAEKDGCGLCLRLQEEDLASDDLAGQLKAALDHLNVKVGKVDLLVDYGPQVPPRSTIIPLINSIPQIKEWRSFTLAASKFPVDMSEVSQYSTVELPREEWENWTHLRARDDKLARVPTFSDYAINYPDPSDIDPRKMRMSANIRYTWTTSYVIAKGEAMPRKKDKDKKAPPAEQYPMLAQAIINHKAWCGPLFSWGDAYIQKCANKACVGGGTEWRAVGTSHHLAFAVQQIASFP
ncbi:MAG: beta family protein [Phycisphaeraceae bacterium]|nr:beta family protein [Phycisphaeraceae bacterium]MBX3366357.1 beta family protein [Phycisphaeraceae bacterium]